VTATTRTRPPGLKARSAGTARSLHRLRRAVAVLFSGYFAIEPTKTVLHLR
jgi:hypothetical protein